MVIHEFNLENYYHEKDLNNTKYNTIYFATIFLEVNNRYVDFAINKLLNLELQSMSNFVDNLLYLESNKEDFDF